MRLKRIDRFMILAAAVMLCGGSVKAQGYFLDSPDVTLEYVRHTVQDGKLKWRHTVRVIDVVEGDNMVRYTTESVFSKPNGKPLYRDAVLETTAVDKRTGNLNMDVGAAMASYVKARTGINATSSGVLSSLPAGIEPGDTLQPVAAQVKVGPLTYSLTVINRKVLRRETISVPAGTYDCIVVSEDKTEKGPGHNRSVTTLTWYSKGVGYVRHDTYINGKLDTKEVLTRQTVLPSAGGTVQMNY